MYSGSFVPERRHLRGGGLHRRLLCFGKIGPDRAQQDGAHVRRALYGGDREDAGAGQAGAAEQSGRRLPYGGADGPGSDRTGERELPGLYRGGVYQHHGGA